MYGGSDAAGTYAPKKRFLFWLILSSTVLLIAGGAFYVFLLFNTPAEESPQSETSQPVTRVAQPPLTANFDLPSGSTVSGPTTFLLTISDLTRVQRVEYYVDDVFVAVTYTRPFSFELNAASLTPGEHRVVAKIYDADGAVTIEETKIVVPEPPSTTPTPSQPKPTLVITPVSTTPETVPDPDPDPDPTPTPPDTTAPSTPTGLVLSAQDGYTAELTWTASTDNVGVSSYKIFRDGTQIGTSASASYKDGTVVPGNTYDYSVAALDAAGNVSAESTEPSITLEPTSIWIDGDTPQGFDSDGTAIEVGVKFRPLVNGKITGVKFYKGTLNTGTHTGNLWTLAGSNLATATFTSETASGWQEVAFSTPVDVVAGTTYVASYFAPNGHISFTSSYFGSAGITSQYLRALPNGVDGNNGVFKVGAGFPNDWFNQTNYWVDVTFAPHPAAGGPTAKVADNSQVYSGYPGSDNTGLPVGKRLPVRDRAIDARQPGTIIENIEVVGASINVLANNTTIRNARVTSAVTLSWGIRQNTGVSGLVVEDSEVYGDGTNRIQYGILDAGSGLTVERVNIHTVSEGIQANQNANISDSFVHDMLEFPSDHNDAFISTGGGSIVLTHNTLHNPVDQTAALGLFCDTTSIINVTATNNLIMGGGYAVYAGGELACPASHDIKFINNRISKSVFPNGGFTGPVTNYNAALSGNQWTGNVWHEDGTTITP